jgi:hypothetical protein
MRNWIASFLRKRIVVISQPDAEVDAPGVALAHALWHSDGFRRLLDQIIAEQSVKDALYLRDCVRAGRQNDATRVEARLEIFEVLPEIFEEVAARYKVDRAQ